MGIQGNENSFFTWDFKVGPDDSISYYSYHLTDIFKTLNVKGMPDNAILVSFHVANMFPSSDNNRGNKWNKWNSNYCFYSDLVVQPKDNAAIDALKTIFQEIFYFGRYRDYFIMIWWTGDVDEVDLLLASLNSLDENLIFTVKICGKSLCYINLKITIDE